MLKFKITFKRGTETVAEVVGDAREYSNFMVGDVTEGILDIEQRLERLTGLRVHIETADD